MKRAISLLLTLVMLLGLLPMATFAEDTETTLPQVTLSVDKTAVKAGDDVTLTLALDKDVDTPVASWQWNFVWNSDYFTAKSSAIGTSVTPILESMPVTPIVNLTAKTYFASPYKAASVTAGNTLTPHYLKAGTIASVTLTATKDIPEGENVKFFVSQSAQIGSTGEAVVVTQLDPTQNWGSDTQTLPDDSVGLIVTAPVAPIDITFYYADKNGIVTGDDEANTLLNFAPVTVEDLNGDGVFTMEEAFTAAHAAYYQDGTDGYEGESLVTKFWGITDSNSSYVHNHRWVFSPQEEIKDGDSVSFFWYQDSDLSDWENSYSDLYTYFDSLTGTATAKEETAFHVNGYSVFGSGQNADAVAAPEGATVTATCDGQDTLTTTVDANGDFKLTFPTAGDWTVLVNGKCSYTCDVGYYVGQTYTDAPVTPAQMTVTVAEAAYVAPDPVKVSVYYSKGNPPAIVEGKNGTALNYVPITVSDKDGDGKLTVNDAFIVLHETYYDGTDGYSRADGSYTFWGFTSTASSNPFVVLNHSYNATVDSEIKEGDKICALNQAAPNFPYAYFDDGVTGTATAGEAATFHITGNRSDGTQTLSGATVTATCGDTTVTGTNDENGNVIITFPSAGTYTMVVNGSATLNGEEGSQMPIHPAMMTVTVAEAQVAPDPTDPADPTDPTESGYTVALGEEKTVNVGETVSIDVKVGHTDEKAETYNAFDMTFSYDATVLTLTSTEIEGLTVTTGDGTVRVQGYGADKAIGSAAFTLTFAAKATGNATVDVTTAKVDAAAHAIDKDAPEVVEATGTSVTVSGYPVTLPDNFTGEKTAEPGKDYTFSEPEDYYDYDVKATVGGEDVTLTDNGDGSYTIKADDVTGEIKVTATKTGKKFDVKFEGTGAGDVKGEATAQYMTAYEATLTEAKNYTYTVTVTIGGKAYTGYAVDSGKYTIPGQDITGEIVFTVTKTPVEGSTFSVKFEGTGAGDAEGDATVAPDASYSFKLNKVDGYDYEVTATMGGQEASFTEDEDTYTFGKVTGDLVITITKSLHLEVEVSAYVQLDGKTVALITAGATLGQGQALSYDGTVMFWSDTYIAWCYLVIVEDETMPTAQDVAAKIVATESTYTTLSGTKDVNESGLVDINDAQLVYDIYNGKYEGFTTVTMQKFLNADVNADREVNVIDAAAVVAAIG